MGDDPLKEPRNSFSNQWEKGEYVFLLSKNDFHVFSLNLFLSSINAMDKKKLISLVFGKGLLAVQVF